VQINVLMAIVTAHLGDALIKQGHAGAALIELQNALAVCNRFWKPQSPNADLSWAIAVNQFEIARAHASIAADAKPPASRREESLRQAISWYQRSIPGLAASSNGSFEQMAVSTLKEAKSELSRSEQELDKLSVGRR
jgi:hypothetical protein